MSKRVLQSAMVVFILSSIAAAIPLPPALTLDIPPSEVLGIWRLTRIASLFGPTPAILLYRKVYFIYELHEPYARELISKLRQHLQTSVTSPLLWALEKIAANGGNAAGSFQPQRKLEWMASTSIWPNFAQVQAYSLGKREQDEPKRRDSLIHSTVGVILSDPRVKSQRLRDSRMMLGHSGSMDIAQLYTQYRRNLELTMWVIQEYIDQSLLNADEALEVQRLVTARVVW